MDWRFKVLAFQLLDKANEIVIREELRRLRTNNRFVSFKPTYYRLFAVANPI